MMGFINIDIGYKFLDGILFYNIYGFSGSCI